MYLLIKSDEDGNPLSWLNDDEVEDIGQLMEDHSITRFLDALPDPHDRDPGYWPDGQALLLEVKVLRVRPTQVVERWGIEP